MLVLGFTAYWNLTSFFEPFRVREIEKFIIRQPPIGGKDDYDSGKLLDLRWAPQQQQKKEERRGGGNWECKTSQEHDIKS